MSNEFWLGAYFGFLTGCAVVLAPVCWDLSRQTEEYLKQLSKKDGND